MLLYSHQSKVAVTVVGKGHFVSLDIAFHVPIVIFDRERSRSLAIKVLATRLVVNCSAVGFIDRDNARCGTLNLDLGRIVGVVVNAFPHRTDKVIRQFGFVIVIAT